MWDWEIDYHEVISFQQLEQNNINWNNANYFLQIKSGISEVWLGISKDNTDFGLGHSYQSSCYFETKQISKMFFESEVVILHSFAF